jgi:2-hydroxychromene-2-carboxylate isomerase
VSDAIALSDVLTKAGFNAAYLVEKAQDPVIKQAVIDNTDQAVRKRGCFGIPQFFSLARRCFLWQGTP